MMKLSMSMVMKMMRRGGKCIPFESINNKLKSGAIGKKWNTRESIWHNDEHGRLIDGWIDWWVNVWMYGYGYGDCAPGPRLNIKSVSPSYGDFRVKDKTVARPSYLRHGDYYTGKTTYLYWDGPLVGGGCWWAGGLGWTGVGWIHKCPWSCTAAGEDNSIELNMEKIHLAV